ncbi:Uncharacterized protein FKW44_001635, partial [Caligus rogercresseyi]
ICTPSCKNNGVCMAPNQCECDDGFMGKTCEIEEERLCLTAPILLPSNALASCSPT